MSEKSLAQCIEKNATHAMKFKPIIAACVVSAILIAGSFPGLAAADNGENDLQAAPASVQGGVGNSYDGDLEYARFACETEGGTISSSQPLLGVGGADKTVNIVEDGDGWSASYQLQYVFQTGEPLSPAGNSVYLGDELIPPGAYEWVYYSVDESVWNPHSLNGYTELGAAPTGLGRYAVSIRGVGSYSGESSKAEVEVIPANDLKGADASFTDAPASSFIYTPYAHTGSAVAPGISVVACGAELVEGTHYVVSYQDDEGDDLDGAPDEIGEYVVAIEAKPGDGYTGAVELKFQIADPKNLMYGSLMIPRGAYYPTYAWNGGNAIVLDDIVVGHLPGTVSPSWHDRDTVPVIAVAKIICEPNTENGNDAIIDIRNRCQVPVPGTCSANRSPLDASAEPRRFMGI